MPRQHGQRAMLSLTRAGFARGRLSCWMRRRWLDWYASVVDAEVRGIRYRLNVADNGTDGKLLLSSKIYDSQELEALCAGPRGVFVDVGANIGYYSLSCAARGFHRVLAIEGNPDTVARLMFNIQSNPWRDAITVAPLCVGSGGKVPFRCTGDLGRAQIVDAVDRPEATRLLASKPLADILADHGITAIDAMKIDIEGYEDQALLPFFAQAARSLWPARLVLESCHRQEWRQDVVAHLLQSGYQAVGETRSGNLILWKA